MNFRRIEIDCPKDALDDLESIEGADCILELRQFPLDDETKRIDMIVGPAERQNLIDSINERLSESEGWRIVVMPVEGILPMPEQDNDAVDAEAVATREEIFNAVSDGAALTKDYAVLTMAAAIVAALGMLRDSTAVVIGAMVIAPLLGPILSLVLATALGETKLALKSLLVGAVGIGIVVAVGGLTGVVAGINTESRELMLRTEIGYDSLVLALASGVAAALSATSGKLAPLVGVMVAAALLPPLAAAGLFLGVGHLAFAGIAMLVAVSNVVCINLAGQLVFLWKGVRPQTWYKQEQAHQSVRVSLATLGASVLVLIGVLTWFQS
jgi:uncharacterized hydrophobic protein (TIGR00341 family)